VPVKVEKPNMWELSGPQSAPKNSKIGLLGNLKTQSTFEPKNYTKRALKFILK
jgi:hypothetical protein